MTVGDDLVAVGADFVPLKEVSETASVKNHEIDRYQRDSLHAEEAFAHAVETANSGDYQKAVQEYLRAAKIAETAREWYVAAVSLERIGNFLCDPKPPFDLERAIRTYHRAVAAYEQSGHYDEARRILYRMQYLKMTRGRELRHSFEWRMEMYLYWLFAGFGFRPLRVVGTAITTVILFGLIYWLSGGVLAAGTHEPAAFSDCLYFSGTTFTTIGYGDYIPAPFARPMALVEGAVGVLSLGFFVVILSNRLRH